MLGAAVTHVEGLGSIEGLRQLISIRTLEILRSCIMAIGPANMYFYLMPSGLIDCF